MSRNTLGVSGTQYSAELKGPRNLLRIRPEIFDFEPDLGLKRGQTKPKISGTAPTNRHTTIPNDSGPISACFDDDAILSNCEIAQPTPLSGGLAKLPKGSPAGGAPPLPPKLG